MQSINNRERITVIALYQKLMVFLIAALIVGNTFQYEPSYYLLLVISILTVFLSRRGVDNNYIKQYVFIVGFAVYGIFVAIVTDGGYGGPLTIVTGLMVVYATQEMKFNKLDIYILVTYEN